MIGSGICLDTYGQVHRSAFLRKGKIPAGFGDSIMIILGWAYEGGMNWIGH